MKDLIKGMWDLAGIHVLDHQTNRWILLSDPICGDVTTWEFKDDIIECINPHGVITTIRYEVVWDNLLLTETPDENGEIRIGCHQIWFNDTDILYIKDLNTCAETALKLYRRCRRALRDSESH